MDNFDWTSVLCYGSLALIVFVMMVPGFIFFFMIGKKKNEEIQKKREEKERYKQSIHDNGGLLAPAVIVAARVLSSTGRGRHGTDTPSFVIEFEAEVTPEDGSSFRTKFRNELFPNGYKVENYEMVSEYGKKLWVTYDPKDTTRAFLDHYDEDHEKVMSRRG